MAIQTTRPTRGAKGLFRAAAIAAVLPSSSQAIDQNDFVALLEEYQTICGRALEAPLAFHTDPATAFGISGESQLFTTEDLSHVDFFVEHAASGAQGVRLTGLGSTQVGGLLEQSCEVALQAPTTEMGQRQLGEIIRQGFDAAPGFEIEGGVMTSKEHFVTTFAVTGIFPGYDIITLIRMEEYILALEHGHLFKLDPQ